jgi:integrase
VSLDENKTHDARTWRLDPGAHHALQIWKDTHPGAGPTDLVFPSSSGAPDEHDQPAERLRAALKTAGITRPELFEDGVNRRKMRAYDLRGTFVTLALATGQTESWVTDRTGHQSSQMLYRYKRKQRLAGELGLKWFRPLHELVPEFGVCPVNAQQPTEAPTTGQSSNDEDPNEVAGVSLVGHDRLELSASGLRVRCSTN